jgi:hypothetical protein
VPKAMIFAPRSPNDNWAIITAMLVVKIKYQY